MATSIVALQVVRPTLPQVLYLDMARLTTRGLMRSRLPGTRSARTRPPIFPVKSVKASAEAVAAAEASRPVTCMTAARRAGLEAAAARRR
jgi:hypothetical protein